MRISSKISSAVGIIHGIAHAGGDLRGNRPVVPGIARRVDRLADPLDPAFGIGKGSVFFGKAWPASTTSASWAVSVMKMS